MNKTQDLNIAEARRLTPPAQLKARLPGSEAVYGRVLEDRQTIRDILAGKDDRLLVVVGPCSIHELNGARDYARRLCEIQKQVASQMFLVMRVYFEKPRTTIGWKGLINDPHLDGSHDIELGLERARSLLLEIVEMGLPVATEFLDPIIPQYTADLVAWAAIGARTTESQTHREMASGLSMPIGFKNGTDGGLQVAIDAMKSARHPHNFLGMDQEGFTSVIRAKGNPHGHVILRGGNKRTNYDPTSIAEAIERLDNARLPHGLMVDCSHANSGKQHAQQEFVWWNVLGQRIEGNRDIIGLMLESYLEEGNQPIPENLSDLKYGVSVTDSCVNWDTTARLIVEGAQWLASPNQHPDSLKEQARFESASPV